MNRNELRVLGPSIKSITHRHSRLWWNLKRQIFDGGEMPVYEARSEFDTYVRRALDRLNPEEMARLRDEWKRRYRTEGDITEIELTDNYAHVMLEEIERRADIAQRQTNNWD